MLKYNYVCDGDSSNVSRLSHSLSLTHTHSHSLSPLTLYFIHSIKCGAFTLQKKHSSSSFSFLSTKLN
jgi:hypothetical protein